MLCVCVVPLVNERSAPLQVRDSRAIWSDAAVFFASRILFSKC